MTNTAITRCRQELEELKIFIAAKQEFDESKVNRAKDGKFASKSGGMADSLKKQAGAAIDSAKKQATASVAQIQNSMKSVGDSLQSNLAKIAEVGGEKLAEFAQSPKVRAVRSQAEELASKAGKEATSAYNQVNKAVNDGLAELSKNIPPDAKAKAKQLQEMGDKLLKESQRIIEESNKQGLAASGASIALSMFNAIAGSMASSISTPEGRDKLMKQGVAALDSPDLQKGMVDAQALMSKFQSIFKGDAAKEVAQVAKTVTQEKPTAKKPKTGVQGLQETGKKLSSYFKNDA